MGVPVLLLVQFFGDSGPFGLVGAVSYSLFDPKEGQWACMHIRGVGMRTLMGRYACIQVSVARWLTKHTYIDVWSRHANTHPYVCTRSYPARFPTHHPASVLHVFFVFLKILKPPFISKKMRLTEYNHLGHHTFCQRYWKKIGLFDFLRWRKI